MGGKGNKKAGHQQTKKKSLRETIYDEASKFPAKITQNNLVSIYHLNETCSPSKLHPTKFRNTNCTNPYCCQKIGLERWEKFKKPPKTDEPKRDKQRDIEVIPCGLYNNANLCYLNSFLQIWYHNPYFRHFVFAYASLPTFANPRNSSGAVIKVQKIMERLQAVFFGLEVSPFEACDAVRLAEALMLQDGQQDVSEFHTLFFAFLEKHLEGHPSLPGFKKVHDKINFRMKQIIECPCKRKVVTENIVAGLHVIPEGCSNVTEMLRKCFAAAPLDGYRCPECGEEGITQMRNETGSLPPVLMIQITRVSADHRKDRTPINYPRELSESTLVRGAKHDHKYQLMAVCVHDGQAASSGHYYDFIFDTRRKRWFHFNDAVVKPIKPPGVETEDHTTKPTSDMRGCYLLLYRRDTDIELDDDEIPYQNLPSRAFVIAKRLAIESERLRNSHERSERYWHKRTQISLNKLEKLFNDLKISSVDMIKKKPQDLVFLPLSLLLDIIDKEHKAVETMVNLNKIEDTAAEERKQRRKEVKAKEQAALEHGNDANYPDLERLQQKYLNVELTPSMIKEIEQGFNSKERKPNGRAKRIKTEPAGSSSRCYIADSSDESDVEEPDADEAAYLNLYVPETVSNQEMPLCMHGKVNLLSVLQGETKAVKRTGAEKLLKRYGIHMRQKVYHHIDGGMPSYSQAHLLTGSELCTECAQDLRHEAVFAGLLDGIEPMLNDILKDSTRQIGREYLGASDDYIVSRKDLANHRTMALQQREYKKLTNQEKDFTTILFSTAAESNGESKTHHGLLSPRSRKRKMSHEHTVKYKVEYMDPSSPLKLKFRREPPVNGEMKSNGASNGKMKKAPVASSEESSSETEEDEMESGGSDSDWNGQESGFSGKRKKNNLVGTPKKKKKTTKSKSANNSDQEPEVTIPKQPVYFNHDIICAHGNCKGGTKLIRLDRHEWLKIVTPFFDDAAVLPGDQLDCDECEQEKHIEQLSNKQNKEILTRINADIATVLKDVERRRYSREDYGTKLTNIICGKFLDNFRQAAKSRSACVNVPSLCQGCLICVHNKPYVDFNKSQVVANAQPITQKEWREVYRAYKTHYPGHNGDLVEIKLSSTGKATNFCAGCCQLYTERESKKKYVYTGCDIYVKMQGDEDNNNSRKKQWRASTRRAAAKTFFKVNMSSNQSVRDLKLEICDRCFYVPDQQLLYNNGDVLEDDKSLEESQVASNNADNPLILIVQLEDQGSREVDRGFQDTALGF